MDNPWGSAEDADDAPLPSFRRESPLQSPVEPVERPEWSVPSWQVEEGQESHAIEQEESAWPRAHDEELESPRDVSQTASPELSSAFPAQNDSFPAFSTHPEVDEASQEPARREEDDFGAFDETHNEAKESSSWDNDAGWGGSSEWPPPSVLQEPINEEASFPSPQLELPEPKLEAPKWSLDTPQLESSVALPEINDVHLPTSRTDEPEDAWAAQAKEVEARRPALPPKIPVELLSVVQERCHQLFGSAFAIDASNAFLPASGMGLALAALLDSDGQLSHLAELKSPRVPLPAPLFAGSAVERLYRAAVEATASRSAEIIKGSASRRGARNAFGSSGGDIWSNQAANEAAKAKPFAFDGASALAAPMLPSERMNLDSLGMRTTSPPLEKPGLFGLFGRRSGAQTNMPSSLLQPKRADSPGPADLSSSRNTSNATRNVSAASRTSTDSASSAPRPLSPSAASIPTNTSTDAALPAGSAVSRFFGKVSGAMKARQDESWFRRKADDDLVFPESRYEDSPGTGFKDELGFSYDNDIVQVSTSPSTARHSVPQDIDNLFDVFDRPTVGATPQKASSSDPFGLDPLRASPVPSRNGPSANGLADLMEPQRPASQPSTTTASAVAQQSMTDIAPLSSLGRPTSQSSARAAPAKSQASFSSFSLAPPPSAMQPLSRSQGTSLLDLDEATSAPSTANADASSFMAPSGPAVVKTRLAEVKKAAPSGSGALSSSDLSFFEDL